MVRKYAHFKLSSQSTLSHMHDNKSDSSNKLDTSDCFDAVKYSILTPFEKPNIYSHRCRTEYVHVRSSISAEMDFGMGMGEREG